MGSSPNRVTSYTLWNGTQDVTTYFALANKVDGTLTVTSNSAVIIITAASDTKVYDRTPLTNGGFTTSTPLPAGVTTVTAIVVGSITSVGSIANVVTGHTLWNGTQNVTTFFTNVTYVNGTLTVTPKIYTITFDSNRGEGDMPTQGAILDDYVSLRLNTFTRTGFEFTGWNTNANGIAGDPYTNGQRFFYDMEGDLTLYAQWKQVIFTVTYLTNPPGNFAPDVHGGLKFDDAGNPPSMPAFIGNLKDCAQGWEFEGWREVDDKGNLSNTVLTQEQILTLTVNRDYTFSAKWKQIPYTVSYDFGGRGGDIDENDIDAKYARIAKYSENSIYDRNKGVITYDPIYYGNVLPTAPYPWAEFGYKFVGWDYYLEVNGKWVLQTRYSPEYFKDPYVDIKGSVVGNMKFVAVWALVNADQKFPDKIPSVTHVDRWWDDYSILCYGASTGDYPYFVGFAPDFFKRYRKVSIGFGTQGTWPYVVTFYKDQAIWEKVVPESGYTIGSELEGYNLVKLAAIDSVESYTLKPGEPKGGNDSYSIHPYVVFDAQHSYNGAKLVDFVEKLRAQDIKVDGKLVEGIQGIWFPDPWGTGAKQAWLGAPIDLFDSTVTEAKIEYITNEGATERKYPVGTRVMKPAIVPKEEGYEYNWQYENGQAVDFPFVITTDLKLYAEKVAINYHITYNLVGGKFEEGQGTLTTSYAISTGALTIDIPTPIKDDYEFLGWLVNDSREWVGKLIIEPGTIGDIKLTAVWEAEETWIVTLDLNGGAWAANSAKPAKTTVVDCHDFENPGDPIRTGYTFNGWYLYVNSVKVNNLPSTFPITVTENITLKAEWTIAAPTVNVTLVNVGSNGNGTVVVPIVQGSTIPLDWEYAKREGFDFGGWFTDSALKKAFATNTKITSATTLYAKWTVAVYTITFISNGGTAVTALKVNHGVKAVAPKDPTRTGYTFGGWYLDADFVNSYTFGGSVFSSFTLYAKWIPIKYTVTFNTNGGSTVSPITDAEYGKTIDLPTSTKADNKLDGWYSDSKLTKQFTATTLITGNITLYAKWSPIPCTVTFKEDFGAGANVIPTKTVNINTALAKPANPTKTGHTFVKWVYENGADCIFPITVKEDLVLIAVWEKVVYTVTLNLNGGTITNKTLSSKISVRYGECVDPNQLPTHIDVSKAADNKGAFYFEGWYTDSKFANKFTTATPVTANITLYAKWVQGTDPNLARQGTQATSTTIDLVDFEQFESFVYIDDETEPMVDEVEEVVAD